MELCLRIWVVLKWDLGHWVFPVFGFQRSRMGGRAELVDMGVLVMEILVGEVKAVVLAAVIVVVEIRGPCYHGNVLQFQVAQFLVVNFFALYEKAVG